MSINLHTLEVPTQEEVLDFATSKKGVALEIVVVAIPLLLIAFRKRIFGGKNEPVAKGSIIKFMDDGEQCFVPGGTEFSPQDLKRFQDELAAHHPQ